MAQAAPRLRPPGDLDADHGGLLAFGADFAIHFLHPHPAYVLFLRRLSTEADNLAALMQTALDVAAVAATPEPDPDGEPVPASVEEPF